MFRAMNFYPFSLSVFFIFVVFVLFLLGRRFYGLNIQSVKTCAQGPPRSELRNCVKVEVAVPNKPTVSVDVKQHFNNNTAFRDQELCESRGGRP